MPTMAYRPRGESLEDIPEAVRTPGKDSCFEALEKIRHEEGLAGKNKSDLSDRTGWSRSHVRNVLSDYYVETEADAEDTPTPDVHHEIAVSIPTDVDTTSFLRGWTAGYSRGRAE